MLTCLQKLKVHANCLKVTGAPVVYGPDTSSSSKLTGLLRCDEVLWIGTHVLITGAKNPMKGYQGIVKDVLPGQTTQSVPRIAVQFTHLNPSAPFKTVIVNLNEVVDAK